MNVMRTIVVATLFATVASTGLAQGRSTDDSFKWSGRIAAGGTLRVRNLAGRITVERASGTEVEVSGVKEWRNGDPADVRFEVVTEGNTVTVCAIWFEGSCTKGQEKRGNKRDRDEREDNDVSVNFTVRLPAGLRLEASAVSADIHVTGATAGVNASSVSGDLVLASVAGDLRLNSVSGDLQVRGATTGSVQANTVSGDMQIVVTQLTGSGDFDFNTVSGEVEITLPARLDATVRMHTLSGELTSDFPLTTEGNQRRRSVEARIGAGGRVLKFNSVSGDVILRRG